MRHFPQEISDLISGFKEADEQELDQELESILGLQIKLPEVPEELPQGKVKMEKECFSYLFS